MIARYGSYAHDDNSTWIHGFSFTEKRSPIGRLTGREMTVVLRGVEKGTSVANLTTRLAAMENAYTLQNQDFVFLDNDGNETIHTMNAANTVNGVEVHDFRYMPGTASVGGAYGSGTEYVNRRTFQVTLNAETIVSESGILLWRESLRLIGDGGPRWAMLGSLTGAVQKQQLQQFTPYKVIQSGFAVGHLGYPSAPAPIWPFALHGEGKVEELVTPHFGRVVNTGFPIRWEYPFEHAIALTGGPTFF